jgi:nucleotide-binding universal stress UspA family protein
VVRRSIVPVLLILVADGHAYVDGLVQQLRRAGIDGRGELMVGPVAETILAVADRCNPAAIAMATHSRSGLGRLAFGSVASEVLVRSERPLLLVHPTEDLPMDRATEVARAPGSASPTQTDRGLPGRAAFTGA